MNRIKKSVDDWIKENSNEDFSNLNEDDKKGLEEIIKDIDDMKATVFHTDKSKKFSVDTPEGYKEDMKPHIEGKKIISEKEKRKIINKYNDISKDIVKILGIGKKYGQDKRAIKNVHMSTECELPVASGLPKDHKSGKHRRPVVNGNVGPVAVLSNILCDYLEPFVEEMKDHIDNDHTCKSTEELLHQFVKYNQKAKPENKQVKAWTSKSTWLQRSSKSNFGK